MANTLAESIEAAKRYVTDAANFRLEQEKEVTKRIDEYKIDSAKEVARSAAQAEYEQQIQSAKEAQKYKEAALKKYNQKVKKEEERLSKELEKINNSKKYKDDNEKKKALKDAENKSKQTKAQYAKELEAEDKKADIFGETAAKRNSRKTKLGKLGTAVDTVSDLISGNGQGGRKATLKSALISATNAVGDFVDSLKSTITQISGYKSSIDTRLQGSKSETWEGSYWDRISKDITGAAGISPLVKQSDIASKVQSMVSQGIAYNVEQRAFLATISDKIATTFESTNGTLARLVRIQQQDSTAARLGMESALTQFLNNMYETTEYMSDVMSGIRNSLEEAEALMTKEASTEFDYQVNKWLGSLYSIGMSQSAVQSIGTALGDLAAGKISGITSDGAGNLIVMAANNAGLSVSDLLQDGLDASNTNKLMTAMVEYLKGIYDDTNGSLVLQQQYADIFGMTASDLKSLANLSTADVKNTASNGLSYSGMLSQLNNMANSMYSRTSQGELLTNLTDNLKYTMAAGIANNVGLYSTFMMAEMLDSMANGIEFSIPQYMGTGTTQTFRISDIMKTGALTGSIISGIASMIGAGGNGGITGSGLLAAFGANSTNTVTRGSGSGLISAGGATYSNSGYVGNASSGDVYEKSMADTEDSTKSQVAEAAEENNEATTTDINNNILLMYQLLQDVTSGTLSFKVDMGDQSSWSQVMHATY